MPVSRVNTPCRVFCILIRRNLWTISETSHSLHLAEVAFILAEQSVAHWVLEIISAFFLLKTADLFILENKSMRMKISFVEEEGKIVLIYFETLLIYDKGTGDIFLTEYEFFLLQIGSTFSPRVIGFFSLLVEILESSLALQNKVEIFSKMDGKTKLTTNKNCARCPRIFHISGPATEIFMKFVTAQKLPCTRLHSESIDLIEQARTPAQFYTPGGNKIFHFAPEAAINFPNRLVPLNRCRGTRTYEKFMGDISWTFPRNSVVYGHSARKCWITSRYVFT